MSTDELIDKVKQWGVDHDLNDSKAQLNKVIEEVGEIAHEISRNRYGRELEDAIGDSLVTIIILSSICGFDPMRCLELAYNEIKDRGGKTEDGTFVKDEPEEEEKLPRVLLRNRVKCKKCGDIIESKSVHDCVWCSCHSIMTDGGLDYIHRGGNWDDMEPMDEWYDPNEPPKEFSPEHLKRMGVTITKGGGDE